MSDNYSAFMMALSSFEANAATYITEPATLATEITNLVALLTQVYSTNLQQALIAQINLFNQIGVGWPVVPLTTTTRQQQALNQAQLIQLIQNAALLQMIYISSLTTYTSSQQAIDTLDEIEALLEPQLLSLANAGDDESYIALNNARTAMIQDITTRAAGLPSTQIITNNANIPALVVAYQHYGDATQESDIVTRNNVVNPVFVPALNPIEILG
jgi:hypothetical protein